MNCFEMRKANPQNENWPFANAKLDWIPTFKGLAANPVNPGKV
jgi:hypothetical protein